MAKRSQRRLARSEKDQLGCMWGFIRLFHFRQGRLTRKLLSDRRRWSSRHATGEQFSGNGLSSPSELDEQYQSGNDGDGSKTQKVDNSRRSVKKLMAEEMSGVQQGPSAAVEKIETDSKHKDKLGKKRKQSKKNPKVARGLNEPLASTSLESQESYCQDLVEQSARNLDLAAVMEEFCSHIRHFHETNQRDGNLKDSGNVQKIISSVKASQLNEFDMDLIRKNSVLQEKLSEATEAFLNQKYIHAKQLARDGKIHQSEQFMDALDILNSNKELFLKLLLDRNSVSLKHMQDIGDSQREEVRCEALDGGKQFQKQNMHKFFRRKAKSEGGNPNPIKGDDCPQASSRIVVLKPSPVNMQTSVATASPQSSLQSQSSLKNQGQSRRVNSNFSFTEIKRKLKHVMRENKNEQHLISIDNSLHRIPSKTQRSENRDKGTHGDTLRRDFPSKTYCHIERIAKSSSYDRRREKVVKPTDFRADDRNEAASTSGGTHENLATTRAVLRQREYNIYEEAKKHLAEILITEDEEEFSSREFPRTLGRILSLPEYNYSPIFSPGKNREYSSTTEKMRFPPWDDSRIVSENVWRVKQDNNAICPSPLKQKPETPLVAVGDGPESRQQNIGSNAEYQEPFSNTKTGDEVIVEITDSFSEGDKNFFEPIVSAPITRSIQADKTAIHKIEGSFELSRMDPHEGNQTPSPSVDSFSLSSSLIQKVKDLDDGPERPSPVSVLEPYFLEEDVSSPASSISRPAEPQIQPLQIHFEENDSSSIITPSDPNISLRICSDDKKPTFEFDENDSSSIIITPSDPDISLRICSDDKISTFEYIRAVLQASGLCWDEFFVKYHSSDHLLNPSLFDEVEVIPDQLNSDPKLLFDCINEVLMEIYERYFGCSLWVSFVKPNSRPAPEGNRIAREVWEGIDWHLDPYIPPHSLDQIVAKDLAKGGTWMDLRFNTEAIGIEMGEIMIDELMEDTILELCSC